jgi:NAD+ synthase (glutamine-hydrolysing)
MEDNEQSSLRKGQGPKVAIAQIDSTLGDLSANMQLHREAIARAKEENVDVLVFPELSLTGYRLKDSVPDVALTRQCPEFLELADSSVGLSIVAGLVLESTEHFFYNAAVYFEDGKGQFIHRKVYLPTYGMFDEQRYFARGNRLAAFATKHGRVAVLICEDMLHPSAVSIAALDGAGVLFVPSASPARGVAVEGEVDANGRSWEEYNRTMARTFGVFVVHANRVGVEDGHTFWGGSEIVGPDGQTLAKAAYYEKDFVVATLSESLQRRQRLAAPLLRDEDVDLTINELCRLRGRERPQQRAPQQGDVRSQRPGGGNQRFDRDRDRRGGRGGPERGDSRGGGRGRPWQGGGGGGEGRQGRQGEGGQRGRGSWQGGGQGQGGGYQGGARGRQEGYGDRGGYGGGDRGGYGGGDRGGKAGGNRGRYGDSRGNERSQPGGRQEGQGRERIDPMERKPRQASEVARDTFIDDGDDYSD